MRLRQKQAKGLRLQENSLTVPDGGVERLVNVLNQRDNIYVKERGFKSIYDASGDTIYGIFEYDEYIVIIFNSQILRIDKFGNVQGSKTSSTVPFEIDGTLRPAPYAFSYAPFSIIENDQAFFCTPEGVRVIRDSSSNASDVPGLLPPTIRGTADLTVTDDNMITAEGVINTISGAFVSGGSNAEVFAYYANDLKLTAADISLSSPENYDAQADRAISYKAVVRRVLPNGQTLESAPSSPVFAFNNLIPGSWLTDVSGGGAANDIIINFYYKRSGSTTAFSVGQKFSGTIKGAVSLDNSGGIIIGSVEEPNVNGRHVFEVTNTGNITIFGSVYEIVLFSVSLGIPPTGDTATTGGDRSGYMEFALDRYSELEVHLPDNIVAGDFIDLYYSRTEVDVSDNPLAIPDGDYYLAKEIKLTSGDISTGSISVDFSDGIFQKGIPLYTNPSDGDLSRQPNVVPPGANCIESWKGHMFYGNTYKEHRVELTHIGGDLTANGTISCQFTDSGTPTAFTFEYIQNEADATTIKKRTMEFAANVAANSSDFIAYFSGGNIDFPGGISIIGRDPNRPFKVFASTSAIGNSMEPVLGTTFAGTDVTSTQEAKRNRIYWSKLNQPEAVPYFVDVGSEDEDILNIKRTRESLIVIKRDGIFSLYGNPASGVLQVREIDTTVKGISATGVSRLGNRVYTKTNQGIVAVSETSMSLVARNQLEPLLKVSDENSTQDTVMYGLEDDRQLYIATATSPSDSTKTVYSYNTLTQTWSEISRVFTWGFVVDNNFTISKTFQNNRVITDGSEIFLERKDYLLTDWTDNEFAFTVSSVSSDKLEVTLSGAFSGPAGSALVWNNGTADKIYRVTEVNGAVVTLNIPFSGVATDSVTLYTPIQSTIRTAPIDGGDSSYVKQFTTFIANMRYDALSTANLSFKSDWFEYAMSVDWTKRDERRGWGQEQWGRFPWGQADAQTLEYLTKPNQIVQTEVPRQQQRTTYLQAEIVHNVACEGMFIQQMAFQVDTTSRRPAR